MKESVEARDQLIKWYIENKDVFLGEDINIQEEMRNRYRNQLDGYYKQYMECIKSCHYVSQTNTRQLDIAYADMDFIFGNKKLRTISYKMIYERLRKYWLLARTRSQQFAETVDNDQNFHISAEMAQDICQEIFTERIIDMNGCNRKTIRVYY